MKERIAERLRKLGREDTEWLAFAAERSVQMMCAYCNREALPERLLGVGVALADRLLEQDGAKAKSIREGDVSITFAESGDAAELLAAFRTELDSVRRADW